MPMIDTSRPVWRVIGHLPDGRRMTVFVNAELSGSETARDLALDEGLQSIERLDLITPEQIARWEMMIPKMQAPRAKCRWCGKACRIAGDGELYQTWCDAPNHPNAGKEDHFCAHERDPEELRVAVVADNSPPLRPREG
jgi:hypothetical protein